MQALGRLKFVAAVTLVVGGTYAYADYMSSVDDCERRTYFPAADVAIAVYADDDDGDDDVAAAEEAEPAADGSDVVQAAAPDAAGESADDAEAVQ